MSHNTSESYSHERELQRMLPMMVPLRRLVSGVEAIHNALRRPADGCEGQQSVAVAVHECTGRSDNNQRGIDFSTDYLMVPANRRVERAGGTLGGKSERLRQLHALLHACCPFKKTLPHERRVAFETHLHHLACYGEQPLCHDMNTIFAICVAIEGGVGKASPSGLNIFV